MRFFTCAKQLLATRFKSSALLASIRRVEKCEFNWAEGREVGSKYGVSGAIVGKNEADEREMK
jgi:hypothetical protein